MTGCATSPMKRTRKAKIIGEEHCNIQCNGGNQLYHHEAGHMQVRGGATQVNKIIGSEL
jgi:hypothetical protein